jgi:hypothetical protein
MGGAPDADAQVRTGMRGRGLRCRSISGCRRGDGSGSALANRLRKKNLVVALPGPGTRNGTIPAPGDIAETAAATSVSLSLVSGQRSHRPQQAIHGHYPKGKLSHPIKGLGQRQPNQWALQGAPNGSVSLRSTESPSGASVLLKASAPAFTPMHMPGARYQGSGPNPMRSQPERMHLPAAFGAALPFAEVPRFRLRPLQLMCPRVSPEHPLKCSPSRACPEFRTRGLPMRQSPLPLHRHSRIPTRTSPMRRLSHHLHVPIPVPNHLHNFLITRSLQ